MKLPLILILTVLTANTSAEPITANTGAVASGVPAPVDRLITDTRVEYTVENIYTEIKAGKKERAELLFMAAKRGYSNACLYAGYMFDHGIAVKQNAEKAFKWFQACSTKHPIAAYDLAVMYAEGRGTSKDMGQAIKWFKASWPALRAQPPQIAIRLAYYYDQQKDWAEAWDWAERASDMNNKKHGDYLMAKMLANGFGRPVDIPQALNRANNALRAYNHNAAALIAWIYASGRTDETNEKAMEMACAYESIGTIMKSGTTGGVNHYCAGLADDAKGRAQKFATMFTANQRQPAPIDFTSTLDGKEPQFKS